MGQQNLLSDADYSDSRQDMENETFGGEFTSKLDDIFPIKYLEAKTGLDIISDLAEEERSSSKLAELRYLHHLIIQLSTPIIF